jgi:carboxypeptidase family protein
MRAVLCATLLALATITLVAQSAPSSQTVKVTGTVVRSDTGAPLPKVQVDLRGIRGSAAEPLSTVSDNNGQFSVDLPPGEYALDASRTGFVLRGVGKNRARRGMGLLSVAPGAAVNVLLRMEPAGAITGRVVDPDGDPVARIHVTAQRVGSRHEGDAGESGETDDLGAFRIYNLAPGSYYVCAFPWMPQAMKQTSATANGAQTRTMILAGGCYPDASSTDQASPIVVKAGDEVHADLSLQVQPAVRVSGRVLGVRPSAKTRVQVMLRQKGRDLPLDTEADQRGAFEFDAVPAGTYRLLAMVIDMAKVEQLAQAMTGNSADAGGVGFESGGFPGMQMGQQQVIVGDTDLTGVQVAVGTGATVRGRITAEDSRPHNFSPLRLILMPTDSDALESASQAQVKPDGAFTFASVMPGDYHLMVYASGKQYGDYFTRSLVFNGKDANDGLLHISGPGDTLELGISANGGSLEGVVTDAKNQPVSETMVIAVPDAAHRSRLDLFGQATTDELGHFSMKGLAPGSYSVIVDTQNEIGENILDSKSLDPYLANAKRLDVRAGSHEKLDLQVPEQQ